MRRNQKGSALLWAITVIMVLMITVAAALGISYSYYKVSLQRHNHKSQQKTEPTYTKTSLFLCEKRRFFMAWTEKGVVTTI